MTQDYSQSFKTKVVEAALVLSEEKGWHEFGFLDLSQKLDCPLADLYLEFSDKMDVLYELGRMIDRKVLEGFSVDDIDDSVSSKDRLFEILMERFDVLNEYRGGFISIITSFKYDPKQALISVPHLGKSMAWMLEVAGISTHGIRGAVKVLGLSGVYVHALRAWMDDETFDMSKTMAALDVGLSKAEVFVEKFG